MHVPTVAEIQEAEIQLRLLERNASSEYFNPWSLEPIIEWLDKIIEMKDITTAKTSRFLAALMTNPPTVTGLELGILTDRGGRLRDTLSKILDKVEREFQPYELPSAISVLRSWRILLGRV
ncbi:hypothetical protein A3H77_02225 [Candidatus Kaiserbacteria bacterium RIFCSPLOWO2_02_FULL_56_11]|uniref:Uncharacterized protein n=2 Tax=Candidatus Kaiseribacteriota TaxID=1752734 RepID=A0A1F6E3F9_9BACT|nr:MAG: hypothetical protein A3C95_00445 [Candidatus Kaiserbacteria bacterium RIFCSPHIGHO2_02_FULL_56_30]OGG71911.1 MAG: hypothetical protein A3E65_00265 [Candidatus Kaiserbacteria bacterium RIFCSPHIGHO2_12_FULL_56_13]OGG81370.1 MAG: hypothetical protein A3H77_02225 [Candidatus Kaiserbacteria bacterium RIFCSPLOWO2_02_FULL_56_11]